MEGWRLRHVHAERRWKPGRRALGNTMNLGRIVSPSLTRSSDKSDLARALDGMRPASHDEPVGIHQTVGKLGIEGGGHSARGDTDRKTPGGAGWRCGWPPSCCERSTNVNPDPTWRKCRNRRCGCGTRRRRRRKMKPSSFGQNPTWVWSKSVHPCFGQIALLASLFLHERSRFPPVFPSWFPAGPWPGHWRHQVCDQRVAGGWQG